MVESVWGSAPCAGHYANHPGLLYEPHPKTFGELLTGTERWADREYLVQGGQRVTYADFFHATGLACERFDSLGVQPGDRVMLLAYNSPHWALAVWSLWLLGATPVLGNRWWSAPEIEHAVGLLSPRCILTDATEPAGSRGAPVQDMAGLGRLFGQGSSDGPPKEVADTRDEDSPALILFTSGTSGMPKAVELSRRSVMANQHNVLMRSRRLPHQLDADAPQSILLVCTPLFHIGGVTNLLTQAITGGKIVLNEGRFDPKQVLQLIQNEAVQAFGGVPTMATRVLEHPDFDSYDLSSLRSWPLGGAPVRPELLDRMAHKLPQLRERGLGNTWGMTESGGFLTVASSRDYRRYPGTVGRPYPVVELRIADPDARGVGEIQVRSPTVMLGYVGIDDDTVDSEGWLHTGDLGHLNEDGYLFIDGRSKDIVIRGGENIACAHVEAALIGHPDVVEVAAIGLPHHELGEELAAVVVH
ncbi:MAG: class I adenylate-forming enzyme family protein, partial [Sciscionella sp.]